MTFPAGRSDCHYGANFNRGQGHLGFRVELYVDARDPASTKALFEAISARLPESAGLVEEELPTRRASRFALYYPVPVRVDDVDEWPAVRAWALDNLGELRSVIGPVLESL